MKTVGPRGSKPIASRARRDQPQQAQHRPNIVKPPTEDVDVPRLGTNTQVTSLAWRILDLYDVPESERTEEVMRVAKKAATMCIAYGFVPGVDVHVYQDGGRWVADAGVRAWVASANRLAHAMGFSFLVQEVELEPDEVKKYVGAEYTPDDCGWAARVVRSDHVSLARVVGMEFDPPWCYGVWRKHARHATDEDGRPTDDWLPDPVWKSRTVSDVARQRAKKAALMDAFMLEPIAGQDASRRFAEALQQVDDQIADRQHRRGVGEPMELRKPVQYEEDGDVLWA